MRAIRLSVAGRFWVAVCLAALGLEAVADLTAEVRSFEGSPTLFIKDKPTTPLMFYGWSRGPQPTSVRLTTEWQQVHVSFVAPEDNEGDCGVHVRFGVSAGTVWLDDARFYEGVFRADAANAHLRCSGWDGDRAEAEQAWRLFVKTEEGAKAGWALDDSTQVTGGQSCKIRIEQAGQDMMHVHLFQTGMSVERGKRYTFSVWLKADREREADLMALHHGPPWTIYSGREDSVFERQVRLAAEAGVHIHSFGIGMPWPKPGQEVDFRGVDAALQQVIEADPEALLLPRFGVEPPGRWLAEHPDEALHYDDGATRNVCVASEVWRREMLEHVRRLVAHCEAEYGDHMLGYHPCAQHTGEWFYPRTWEARHSGFGPAMQRGFAAWLKGKYTTPEALREAWGDPAADFEHIDAPTVEERATAALGAFRDPAKEQRVIDFHEYQQVAMVEPLELLARAIKEETARRKLVVLFYGYYFEISGLPLGPQTSGHLALGRLLECPDVDIVCSPISYQDRGLGGMGAFMVPVDSVRLHGKLWLNEDDTRTFLTPEDAGYGRVDTLQHTQWVHQRNFGHLLPRRLACWYMDLGGAGWLEGKGIWDNVASLRGIYDEHVAKPAQWAPEVGVIVDETGPFYLADNREIMATLASQFRTELYRMGAPFGIYLLSDFVAGRVPPAKAYFFLSAFHLDAAERRAIAERVRGATAVWMYGSGYLSERPSVEAMSVVVGMKVREATGLASGMVTVEEGEGALVKGLAGVQFGTQKPLVPTWAILGGPDVEVIARFEGGAPAVAMVPMGAGHSIYVSTLTVPAQLLRNILKVSGVHVWLDSDDVLLTDGKFLAVSASEAGKKTILLPGARSVTALPGGEVVAESAERLNIELERGETRFYWLTEPVD